MQDVRAYKSMPLPGYQISAIGPSSLLAHSSPSSSSSTTSASAVAGGTSDAEMPIFKVAHRSQISDVQYFLADNVAQMTQCVIFSLI